MMKNLAVVCDDPLAPDDDSAQDTFPNDQDYKVQIANVIRSHHYKPKSQHELDGINWKLNRIQSAWGCYAAKMADARSVQPGIDVLLKLRSNLVALRDTWHTVKATPLAGRILFADAIAKTGQDQVIFDLGDVLTSDDLEAVLSGLTAHQLRTRLPTSSGPTPIDPLVIDLVRMQRRLASGLVPLPHRKGVTKKVSVLKQCQLISGLLSIIDVNFSASAVRNAVNKKVALVDPL